VLKLEQKHDTSLHTSCYKDASRGKQAIRGPDVYPSQLYMWIFVHRTTRNSPTDHVDWNNCKPSSSSEIIFLYHRQTIEYYFCISHHIFDRHHHHDHLLPTKTRRRTIPTIYSCKPRLTILSQSLCVLTSSLTYRKELSLNTTGQEKT
jgi:hypothetical protein